MLQRLKLCSMHPFEWQGCTSGRSLVSATRYEDQLNKQRLPTDLDTEKMEQYCLIPSALISRFASSTYSARGFRG
jgi:hypothetical protein